MAESVDEGTWNHRPHGETGRRNRLKICSPVRDVPVRLGLGAPFVNRRRPAPPAGAPVIAKIWRQDQVTDYRVYILNDKGHIQSDTLIVCDDDAQAIEAAKRLVGVRHVEMWDGERLVGRFKTTPDG